MYEYILYTCSWIDKQQQEGESLAGGHREDFGEVIEQQFEKSMQTAQSLIRGISSDGTLHMGSTSSPGEYWIVWVCFFTRSHLYTESDESLLYYEYIFID